MQTQTNRKKEKDFMIFVPQAMPGKITNELMIHWKILHFLGAM